MRKITREIRLPISAIMNSMVYTGGDNNAKC